MYNTFEPKIIDTYTKTVAEDAFFSERFTMSYSSLNRLLFSPQLFYNDYVLKNRKKEVEKHLIEGSLIHCMLLTPGEDNFNKQFVITPADLPSDNSLKVLQRVFEHYKELNRMGDPRTELQHFEGAILDTLADMNLHQALKTDDQRVSKIVIDKNIEYWNYLIKAEGRSIIDDSQYAFAKNIVEIIQSKSLVMRTLGFLQDTMIPLECYNEFYLVAQTEEFPFDLRGYVDNMVIDHEEKKIRINDLKKTSKSISTFPETIQFYRYDLQAAMYRKLVTSVFQEKYPDYKIEFRFVVVDYMLQIAVFKIKDETLDKWYEDLTQQLQKAAYHFDNKNFDLPYEFLITNEVEL
jgi:hypothetical protein